METPVITIIGKSGTGKTTLLEQLIAEFKRRGYYVGTVKHHSHRGFEIDQPGKDSWRHAQAGSDHVVIASVDKIAAYRSLERELSLDEIVGQMVGLDIILVEGYKCAGKPTIEVASPIKENELLSTLDQLIGIVTEDNLDVPVPQFKPIEANSVVDFLEERFLIQKKPA